jgi:hypothetical protein
VWPLQVDAIGGARFDDGAGGDNEVGRLRRLPRAQAALSAQLAKGLADLTGAAARAEALMWLP